MTLTSGEQASVEVTIGTTTSLRLSRLGCIVRGGTDGERCGGGAGVVDAVFDRLDHVGAVTDGPVASTLSNGVDLSEHGCLVPVESDLADLALTIVLDNVDLDTSQP